MSNSPVCFVVNIPVPSSLPGMLKVLYESGIDFADVGKMLDELIDDKVDDKKEQEYLKKRVAEVIAEYGVLMPQAQTLQSSGVPLPSAPLPASP